MNKRKLFTIFVVTVLAFTCAACGVPGQLPKQDAAIESADFEKIQIPVPAESPVDLNIAFGPGKLHLRGGSEDGLVEGEVRYNRASLRPGIDIHDDQVSLSSGGIGLANIGEFTGYLVNEWSVRLGAVPMKLTMKALGVEGDLDLGGIPIQTLDFNGKAVDVKWSFSSPNPVQMDTFYFDTTASDVELSGLANANFERMVFTSDLGDFTLDFSGELQRDTAVMVESGASEVDIVVPQGTRARVTVNGGLSDVESTGGWEKSGSTYTLPGDGPLLEIRVKMTVGNLNLQSQ